MPMSPLAQHWNETSDAIATVIGEESAQDAFDIAGDYAIELLAALEIRPDEHDDLGEEHAESVQSLLALAMARSSDLRMGIANLLEQTR